jgi:hypothetical protein
VRTGASTVARRMIRVTFITFPLLHVSVTHFHASSRRGRLAGKEDAALGENRGGELSSEVNAASLARGGAGRKPVRKKNAPSREHGGGEVGSTESQHPASLARSGAGRKPAGASQPLIDGWSASRGVGLPFHSERVTAGVGAASPVMRLPNASFP